MQLTEKAFDALTSERVIVYLGPTLSKERALALIPKATILPPAKQSDILTDIRRFEPTHILLIDGEFHQNLSVWVKEIIFALANGIRVFGCSSMGALRAVELTDFGMVGVGRIFEWILQGVVVDDSEVAVAYDAEYKRVTIPLVNVRSTFADSPDRARAIEIAAGFHYTERTDKALRRALKKAEIEAPKAWRDQKAADALDLLKSYRKLAPKPTVELPPVNRLLLAQDERDRQVDGVAQQHIDAHVMLTDPAYDKHLWDANNRQIADIWAQAIGVQVTEGEMVAELQRFCFRNGLKNEAAVRDWYTKNFLVEGEFNALLLSQARVRKLQHALVSTRGPRRNTKTVSDYLRTWNRYEGAVQATPKADDVAIDVRTSAFETIKAWFEKRPDIKLDAGIETYAFEAGFGNVSELAIAIQREAYGQGCSIRIE